MVSLNSMVKETAEKLVGRSLISEDGIKIERIEEIEFIIETKFPDHLREFYLNIGNIQLFTKSFEQFIDIEKVYFKDNKLVFLEENQGVCSWGININEDDPIVYQNATDEWYSEEIKLSEFIQIMMYYQCAQGYGNSKNIDLEKTTIEEIISKMEKVVDTNHLIIYWKNNVFVWYYTDDENNILNNAVIVAGLTEEKLKDFMTENKIQ